MREIDRLIRKLELDKEILADPEGPPPEEGARVIVSNDRTALGINRRGQIGKIMKVYTLPGDGSPRADVRFDDGPVVQGLRLSDLEEVP